ncbi:hypothetical protein HK100_006800 [Physocladia obscura]|uniref:Uncharacterized protein n=1 Tax=Physocladia obscura TaxID=109957 RepID=A0AAD5XB54_9FUNG|nr:hypothetical protein HK100_006800 [Physocladia obscura]
MDSLWADFNAALPTQLRLKNILESKSMAARDERLKEAKLNVDKCNRKLARDRTHLDTVERKLMNEIRYFSSKGDSVKARIAARQISHYRTASDRNYESAAMITTRAQLMLSNNKINQAKIEALKGSRYACINETIETVAEREYKYAHMMGVQEEMERIMNEGMDDVYESAEDLIRKRDYFDLEVEAILKQALDPKQYNGRTYAAPPPPLQNKHTIFFKLYNFSNPLSSPQVATSKELSPMSSDLLSSRFPTTPSINPLTQRTTTTATRRSSYDSFDISPNSSSPASPSPTTFAGRRHCSQAPSAPPPASFAKPTAELEGSNKKVGGSGGSGSSSLKISTLELSIDMLKRQMIGNTHLMAQLNLKKTKNPMYDIVLGSSKPFRLGRIDATTGEFEEFDTVKSLSEVGIKDGAVVWVVVESDD